MKIICLPFESGTGRFGFVSNFSKVLFPFTTNANDNIINFFDHYDGITAFMVNKNLNIIGSNANPSVLGYGTIGVPQNLIYNVPYQHFEQVEKILDLKAGPRSVASLSFF